MRAPDAGVNATDQPPVTMPSQRPTPFDPPEELARLREREPLSRMVYPDGHAGWLVTSYALAKEVLTDNRFSARSELKRVPVIRPSAEVFAGIPALPGWMVDMDRPEHGRIRSRVAGRFTHRRIQQLRPRLEAIVHSHLETMAEAGPPADLVEHFALPVPSVMICELLGVPYVQHEEFQHNSAALFSLENSADEAGAAMQALDALLADLVRRKRRVPADDLLSELVVDGTLGDAEIAGLGVLLLTAGHETSASMLALGTLTLLCNQEQRARLCADLSLMDNAVEELLRYLTIFQFGVPRTALVDVEITGRVVRAGESVTVSLPAANRDPARFTAPDELDLGRRAQGHLAFGFGVHQCVGQHLARLELAVGFRALLTRFPDLRLAGPLDTVKLAANQGFYGVHELPVIW